MTDDATIAAVMRDKVRAELAKPAAAALLKALTADEATTLHDQLTDFATTVYKAGYDDGRTRLRAAFDAAWKLIGERYGR